MSEFLSAAGVFLGQSPLRTWCLGAVLVLIIGGAVVSRYRAGRPTTVAPRGRGAGVVTMVTGLAVAALFGVSWLTEWIGAPITIGYLIPLQTAFRIAMGITIAVTIVASVVAFNKASRTIAVLLAGVFSCWLLIGLTSPIALMEAAFRYSGQVPATGFSYIWGVSSHDINDTYSTNPPEVGGTWTGWEWLISAAVLGLVWTIWIILMAARRSHTDKSDRQQAREPATERGHLAAN